MSRPYSEAMAMRPDVSYIPCSASSKEKTGDIITLAQFEDRDLLSETREDAEINDKRGDESNENSIIPPLLILEESNALNYGDESDDEHISTEMLEDIRDISQSHLDINRRYSRYKIRDFIKQIQS